MDESLIYTLGMIGNLLFGVKSFPQIVTCYKQKSTSGISKWMLLLDFGGNTLCAAFIYGTTGFTLWPQFVNYFCATLFLLILFTMTFLYRNN